jgi:hypothetical protein
LSTHCTFAFPNDGKALVNTTNKYAPQDHGAFPTTYNWLIPGESAEPPSLTICYTNPG